MNDLLTAALAYAMAGVAVLPLHTPTDSGCSCQRRDCGSIGKHPRTMHGLADASTDDDMIARWWRRWPDANVGGVVPDGYAVLDVDAEPDEPLPPTLRATTGRGSHNWYSANGTRAHGRTGVDVRHAGANYLVLPPSLHASGTRYAWDGTFDLARAVALPADWSEPAAGSQGDEPRTHFALPDAIASGTRHRTLLAYGGALRRQLEDAALIRAALADANRTRCQPPLPDDELATLTASVLRYQPQHGVILDLTDDPPDEQATVDRTWTRLPPVERVVPVPHLLWPLISDSRSMLFGQGMAGKGVLAAACIAALTTGDAGYVPSCEIEAPRRVGILDYEDNRYEWETRLQRLDIEPGSVPYLSASRPLTDKRGYKRVAEWAADEQLDLALIDSAIPAAGAADAMKPEGPLAFYRSLGRLDVATWLLAHVPKAHGASEYPFGSVYWATQQRLIWRIEKLETSDPERHIVRLTNTKHSRWPWTPPVTLEVEWGARLRVRSTGLALADDDLPLVDRIVAAVSSGEPLTADAIATLLDTSAAVVREQLRRHPHRLHSDGGRPMRIGAHGW